MKARLDVASLSTISLMEPRSPLPTSQTSFNLIGDGKVVPENTHAMKCFLVAARLTNCQPILGAKPSLSFGHLSQQIVQ